MLSILIWPAMETNAVADAVGGIDPGRTVRGNRPAVGGQRAALAKRASSAGR